MLLTCFTTWQTQIPPLALGIYSAEPNTSDSNCDHNARSHRSVLTTSWSLHLCHSETITARQRQTRKLSGSNVWLMLISPVNVKSKVQRGAVRRESRIMHSLGAVMLIWWLYTTRLHGDCFFFLSFYPRLQSVILKLWSVRDDSKRKGKMAFCRDRSDADQEGETMKTKRLGRVWEMVDKHRASEAYSQSVPDPHRLLCLRVNAVACLARSAVRS